jgi:hypothetical protein
MKIVDYQTYEDYFQEIATGTTGHKQIKSFFLGSVNEIEQSILADLSYPCFWLEDCDVNFSNIGRDNDNIGFASAFLILFQCDPNDFIQKKAFKQQALIIARDVVSRMRRDFEDRTLNIDGNFTGNFIDSILVDAACGLRVEFNIRDPFDLRFNPDNWKS